jgi:hypothetical protein
MPLNVTDTTLPALTETARHINRLLDASKAKSTRRSYGSDVRQYEAWCKPNDKPTFPAEPSTVIAHIAWCALPKPDGGGLTASSIGRRLCAIADRNKLANPIKGDVNVGNRSRRVTVQNAGGEPWLEVLSGYVRSADLFNDHAGESFL